MGSVNESTRLFEELIGFVSLEDFIDDSGLVSHHLRCEILLDAGKFC